MPTDASHRHFVLTSTGTDGDLRPFLELGCVLRARGHRVTLATHEHFRVPAGDNGLEFAVLVTDAETRALVDQEALWSPLRGAVVLARWGMRLVPRQYRLLREAMSQPGVHLVASPGVVAARVVEETQHVPFTSVVLQPWLIPSTVAPPAMLGGLSPPAGSPRWMFRVQHRLLDLLGGALIGGDLARLRRPLGLPRIHRLFRWWFSESRVVGLFPDWYAAPQSDWPPHTILAGFPGTPRATPGSLPPEVEAFCRRENPPIAFTFGTGMKHASGLFDGCMDACRIADRRGLFVTRYREQLPADLPPGMLWCPFVPFDRLFPRCAAVVHHGGIGTTAQALAAGCPQLILPFAFDQLDNALRVQRLGVGHWLPRRGRQATAIASALNALEAGTRLEQRQALARKILQADGLVRTAEILEGAEASGIGRVTGP